MRPRGATLSIGLLALALGSCASIADRTEAASASAWITLADGSMRLAPLDVEISALPPGAGADISVDTSQRFQRFEGYGAAITDASAYVIQRLPAVRRDALLRELFGRGGGIGLNVIRVPIGASDFSRTHYTFADTPGTAEADIAPAKTDLIPTLRAIRAINPGLQTIASPWSAPAWMKTSGSLIKGRLDPAHHAAFSRYLVSFTKRMGAAGVPVDMLTLQNEPHFEPADYPGMRVEPAERARLIADHLGPLMDREIPRTKLLDWDHNWNEPDSPLAVLANAKAAAYVDGVAWHCYGGEVTAQSLVHDRHPDKETWFTECSAGKWSGSWADSFRWSARTLIIGAPRNWARGVVMWNLALDESNGPHLGGCADCRGLVTIDSRSGAITREPEYYAFAHGSRFVPVGSVRVGATPSDPKLAVVAFQHGAGGPVTAIVLNERAASGAVSIAIGGHLLRGDIPPGALATFVVRLRTR